MAQTRVRPQLTRTCPIYGGCVEVSSSPQYFFVFVVFEFSPDTLDRAEEDPQRLARAGNDPVGAGHQFVRAVGGHPGRPAAVPRGVPPYRMQQGMTGIGLTLSPAGGALRVTAMDPEGPAAKGGLIMPGDMLYEVDDTGYAPPRWRRRPPRGVCAYVRARARLAVADGVRARGGAESLGSTASKCARSFSGLQVRFCPCSRPEPSVCQILTPRLDMLARHAPYARAPPAQWALVLRAGPTGAAQAAGPAAANAAGPAAANATETAAGPAAANAAETSPRGSKAAGGAAVWQRRGCWYRDRAGPR